MIIGRAIGRLLEGETVSVDGSDIALNYSYGNQDALDKYIAESNKKGATKYPLIFYVTNHVKDLNGWKYCQTDIIIMIKTKEEFLYKNRTDKVYIKYIEPIYQKLRTVLMNNAYFQNLEERKEDKFSYLDVPNYGIGSSNVGDTKSKKSVTTDYVDARKVKLKFRIKTNCI